MTQNGSVLDSIVEGVRADLAAREAAVQLGKTAPYPALGGAGLHAEPHRQLPVRQALEVDQRQ